MPGSYTHKLSKAPLMWPFNGSLLELEAGQLQWETSVDQKWQHTTHHVFRDEPQEGIFTVKLQSLGSCAKYQMLPELISGGLTHFASFTIKPLWLGHFFLVGPDPLLAERSLISGIDDSIKSKVLQFPSLAGRISWECPESWSIAALCKLQGFLTLMLTVMVRGQSCSLLETAPVLCCHRRCFRAPPPLPSVPNPSSVVMLAETSWLL